MAGDASIDDIMAEMAEQQGYDGSASSTGVEPTNSYLEKFLNKRRKRYRLLPEVDGYPSLSTICPEVGWNESVWNPYVSCSTAVVSAANGAASSKEAAVIPTNPDVELLRRRAYEQLKRGFKCLFKEWCQEPRMAKMNLFANNVLPIQTILERWQCVMKLEEEANMNSKDVMEEVAQDSESKLLISLCSQGASTGDILSMLMSGELGLFDPVLPISKERICANFGHEKGKECKLEDVLWSEVNFQLDRHNRQKKKGPTVTISRGTFKSWSKKIQDLTSDVERQFLTDMKVKAGIEQEQKARFLSVNATKDRKKKRNKEIPRVHEDDDDSNISVTYAGLSLSVNAAHFSKLQTLFDRFNTDSDSKEEHLVRFRSALFTLLARYDMLEGAGLQSSLTGDCFDFLLTDFDCRIECFASPLNCRYERYCSAYPDTDAPFGSLGSFFDFKPRRGCYQANPPFVPALIERMVVHMQDLLSQKNINFSMRDKQEDQDGDPLMFVVFVPSWTGTKGWKMLQAFQCHRNTHALVPQSDYGYYCEGTQYRRKSRYRVASFDTSVFFLQNRAAHQTWPVTEKKICALRQAFLHCNKRSGGRKEGNAKIFGEPSVAVEDFTVDQIEKEVMKFGKTHLSKEGELVDERREKKKAKKEKKKTNTVAKGCGRVASCNVNEFAFDTHEWEDLGNSIEQKFVSDDKPRKKNEGLNRQMRKKRKKKWKRNK